MRLQDLKVWAWTLEMRLSVLKGTERLGPTMRLSALPIRL